MKIFRWHEILADARENICFGESFCENMCITGAIARFQRIQYYAKKSCILTKMKKRHFRFSPFLKSHKMQKREAIIWSSITHFYGLFTVHLQIYFIRSKNPNCTSRELSASNMIIAPSTWEDAINCEKYTFWVIKSFEQLKSIKLVVSPI